MKGPNNLRGRQSGFPNLSYIFILLFALSSMLFCCSYAMADGPSLWGNLNYISTEEKEDGERILTQGSYFRNLYFNFEKPITPLISYQLNFRTNWSDFRLTDAQDSVTKTYQRAIEPAFDLYLRNPIYNFSAGYRRLEQWDTDTLQAKGRTTTEFIYTRLNITPPELPALSLEMNRQKEFDYLSPKKIDTTDTQYSATSWYQYLNKGLNLSYNFRYTYDNNETPVNPIEETKNFNLNGLYNASYFKTFWSGKADISASYQGNYIKNKTEFFASLSGDVPVERSPFGGFFALGTALNTFEIALNSVPALDDNNLITGIPAINLGTTRYNNIGILVSSAQSVGSLFIYVNVGVSRDLTTDTNLTISNNWKAYKSDTNSSLPGTWQPVPILHVRVAPVDLLNNIFRYEIQFPTTPAQNANYFKVVNMETVNATGITNVFVTEIKAFGTENISHTGKTTETNDFFNQGINLTTNLRATPKLNFSLNYFLNRSDQNPVSFINSVGGVFSNLVSDSISEGDNLKSNILRTYGATTTWFTHRLLTTIFQFQRNEAFDNRNQTDFSSNTYTLTFNSVPVPNLNTNLSFIKNDNYNFGDKDTSNDSVLLSILSKLYRDVNMVTDVVYTRSKSYVTDITTNTTSVRGSIDANLTQRLYGSLIYGLSWISGGDTSSHAAEGQTIITYRPGRFINITGNLRVLNVSDGTTTSEGILVDWLPLPALRLNLNYTHSNSDVESEPSLSDLISAYFIWYITKFIDLQFTSSYTRQKRDVDTKNYTFGLNLNFRVW